MQIFIDERVQPHQKKTTVVYIYGQILRPLDAAKLPSPYYSPTVSWFPNCIEEESETEKK